jgi:muramoyltetrapeptide carboxypeptidase LdcA involved in peptidoglycan recycling
MCISTLKKNPKFFLGFSDPANFLHQPASSLKKNPKKKFGFSDPANFLHQPT